MTLQTQEPTAVQPVAPPRVRRPVMPPVQPGRPRPRGVPGLVADMVRSARDVLSGRPRPLRGGAIAGFTCCHCGGRSGDALFDRPVPAARGYQPVRCADCELVAIHPMPAPEQVPGFYEAEYYGDANAKFGPLTEHFVGWFRRARVRAVRRTGLRSGRVLDIGCARGVFLEQLQRRGFEVYGTELSVDSARGARARLGDDRVRVGALQDCGFEAGEFDVVTAWQVFEHLTDPAGVLAECRRLLRPQGVLILAVPNIDSWQARWSEEEWFHLDVPRHLFHFSPESLSRLLVGQGFRVERVVHQNLEQNPFGLLQSALHRVGRRFNGLYDLLKGRRDRTGLSPWRRALYFAAYLGLFPVAALVSAGWSAIGSGATFTIHARRL